MKSKKLITVALILLIVFPLVAFKKIMAANSATVAATVTLQNVSVTVSNGTIAYGTLSVGTSKSTIATDLNNTQVITNNGNVAEDINIKGQNSANWTLAASPAADTYTQKFCTASCTVFTNYTALTTNYQTLATDVGATGTKNLDLQLLTPTSSSVFTSQSVDVSIQAVAH